MGLEDWLVEVAEKKASDLLIMVGVPVMMKINGLLVELSTEKLSPEQVENIVVEMMDAKQKKEFFDSKELNFSIQRKIGRFRVSALRQRSCVGAVLRRIETHIPTLEELGMPTALYDFAMMNRGLILVVGPTGAGKSTTLAAMLGHRNRNSKGHIITIEDPIEFIHEHESCVVTQREVGIDTDSYEIGLRNALRQAPDMVLIGEIRSRDTMGYALAFAETGHICLATLHANNANQAFDRITSFFPHEMHPQLWMGLSLNLKLIIAQQLVPTVDEGRLIPAIEILINTPAMADGIRKNALDELRDLMTRSNSQGMQTYDQALFNLYVQGKITHETALKYAESENEVRLMIKLSKGTKGIDTGGLSLLKDE